MLLENLKLQFRAWRYKKLEDPAEINYLLSTIRHGDTVFDIGAHKGGYTFWMEKAVGENGKVIAFEPQEKGARLLRNLFRGRNVHVVTQALSNKKGRQDFFVSPQENYLSYEASLENKYNNAERQEVDTTSIDMYCHDNGVYPSFIKIDVEGHEKQVLEGAAEIIVKHHPVLLIEIEERHIGKEKMEEIFSLLKTQGYKGYFFYKTKKTSIEEFDPALHQQPEMLTKNKKFYSNNFAFEYSS
jgi:FkbM family methyltransferase